MYQPGSKRDIGTFVSPMRAAVAIPAAARWTDRQAVAVRFAMLNMVASFGVENDGDEFERGSEVVVGGEGGENSSDRLLYAKVDQHYFGNHLRKFRIHPTDGPITTPAIVKPRALSPPVDHVDDITSSGALRSFFSAKKIK